MGNPWAGEAMLALLRPIDALRLKRSDRGGRRPSKKSQSR
jgi:hypothetical protein